MTNWTVRLAAVALFCATGLSAGTRADLSGVSSWGIWLQNADIDTLANASQDLFVIDYSRDGTDATAYSADDIATLHAAGKKVLAYISIGEAEDYRFYWKSSWRVGHPGFIAAENPDWPGDYAVKYWTSGWWTKAIRPYLDRILDAGYDGVFLDGVDQYWWWYEEGGIDVRRCANRMVQLVEKIADYCRTSAGDGFIVCPLNGVSLLDDASSSNASDYLSCVDSVCVESLFYNYWSLEDQTYRLEKLQQFADSGKAVFNVEYIDSGSYADYESLLSGQDFPMVGYAADPDALLDELVSWQ